MAAHLFQNYSTRNSNCFACVFKSQTGSKLAKRPSFLSNHAEQDRVGQPEVQQELKQQQGPNVIHHKRQQHVQQKNNSWERTTILSGLVKQARTILGYFEIKVGQKLKASKILGLKLVFRHFEWLVLATFCYFGRLWLLHTAHF